MLFVGVDWGERRHDVCLLDPDGSVLAARRIPDGLAGATELHAPTPRTQPRWRSGSRPTGACWSGRCWPPATRSPRSTRRWWAATAAATGSGGPSPTAPTPRSSPDLVRTDRHNHRQVAGDTPAGPGAVKVLARAHQGLLWARQRHVNALRSALREYYPGALTRAGRPAGRAARPWRS
jgi:hypothetical protein